MMTIVPVNVPQKAPMAPGIRSLVRFGITAPRRRRGRRRSRDRRRGE
jgi:hypothetical protein